MTFRMGFYEIMRVREYCRGGGGGGYNVVFGIHYDTTRVHESTRLFCASPKLSLLRQSDGRCKIAVGTKRSESCLRWCKMREQDRRYRVGEVEGKGDRALEQGEGALEHACSKQCAIRARQYYSAALVWRSVQTKA